MTTEDDDNHEDRESPVWKRGYNAAVADLKNQRETELAHHRLLVPWSGLMQSLDRCKHGRHALDDCFDCASPHNEFLTIGQRLGTNVRGGEAIILPSPDVKHEAAAWLAPANKTGPCHRCRIPIANRYADIHRQYYCPATSDTPNVRWSREGPREY